MSTSATDTTNVNAYIGPSQGNLAANSLDVASVTTSGTGVTVTASLTSHPLATSSSLGISLGADF